MIASSRPPGLVVLDWSPVSVGRVAGVTAARPEGAPTVSIEAPDWLVETSFEELFLRGASEAVLARPGIIDELIAIIESGAVGPAHKVLAHELMLAAGQPGRPDLAATYCAALPEGFAHNWWGMPGQYDELLGRTLVSFGKAALPCLGALLGDERPLGYFGSEEPTINARYGGSA